MAIPLPQVNSSEQSAEEPFDFPRAAASAAADTRLKQALLNAVMRQHTGRQEQLAKLPDGQALRELGAAIKQHALDNLDYYLQQLKTNVERNGGQVHFAADAADARHIILDIAAKAGCKRIVKSKSMASEEVDLDRALESAGLDVVETDLGEFIAQISHQRPSHIVAPVAHMSKAAVAEVFTRFFNTPCNDDPESLTAQARLHLREKFRRADMGMTGGNFLIAETGQVCVVENEGNARQSTTTPRVLISLVGIEKLVPRMADLAVLIKLLARSSTGQAMTVYTQLFGGPRRSGEKDGCEEFHLVLLDNGRSRILGTKYRDTLRCIRCGACLNACPVYRTIGGHAYGAVYSGPIGAVLSPLMEGLEKHKHLPQASTLCGACLDACPVMIDLPRHLIELRREIVEQKLTPGKERFAYRLWAGLLSSRMGFRFLGFVQKWVLKRKLKRLLPPRQSRPPF